MGNDLVTHVTAVDIGVLVIGPRTGCIGQTRMAGDAQWTGAGVQGHALLDEVGAQYVGHTGGVRRRGAPLLHQLALMPDGEADLGPGQGVTANRLDAVGQLGGVGLEELAARRCAEKQLLDFHRGADGPRGGAQFAGARVQQEGGDFAFGAREQAQLGDRGDGGQRLAPKAHGAYRLQVGQRGDLAGRMTLEGDAQLARRDAQAVVLDADQAGAAGEQAHGDLASPGVQRVVHQLAHHRGRALDDLARGDLADQFVGQFTDRAACGGIRQGGHPGILGCGP